MHLKLKNFETLIENHDKDFFKVCSSHRIIHSQYNYGHLRDLIAKLENLVAKLFIYHRLWTNTIQFSDLYKEIKFRINRDYISIEDIEKFSIFQPLTTEEFEELFLNLWEEFIEILKNFFKV